MLTTERFFSSVNYLTKPGAKLSDLKESVEIDPLSHGVDSLFNHFAVFRYVDNIMEKYEPDSHFVGYQARHNFGEDRDELRRQFDELAGGSATTNTAEDAARIRQGLINTGRAKVRQAAYQEFISNPTAGRLIDWSSTVSYHTNLGYQPYAWTDFAYCKFYGKIPNNRLITLRRYPFPVADVLKGFDEKPLIPMAQAVTWFGGETDNKLSTLGNWSWDMPWEKLTVTEQNIQGNEVLVSDITSALQGVGGSFGAGLKSSLELITGAAGLVTGDAGTATELSGYDAKINEYVQGLYDKDKGPYWNRIYGPVNVIHESSRRSRGIQTSWQTGFVVKFHYQFRSFSGMSPKMAALDLLSNFLALTHNDAQFLGILARYFPKPGLKFNKTTTQILTDLLMSWGMGKLSTKDAVTKITTIIKSQAAVFKQVYEEFKKNPASVGGDALNAFALSKMAGKLPEILKVKSALSDRPVGEWHLVIGNPMNPIFVMGDLICTKTVAKFDDELGPDDFPTGVTFDVTLQQAKPRDKTALERMFNSGLGSLTTTRLNPPSSADDTFNEENNKRYKEIYNISSPEDADPRLARYKERVASAYGLTAAANASGPGANTVQKEFKENVDQVLTTYFRKNITKV
jgi:hypothetical protein